MCVLSTKPDVGYEQGAQKHKEKMWSAGARRCVVLGPGETLEGVNGARSFERHQNGTQSRGEPLLGGLGVVGNTKKQNQKNPNPTPTPTFNQLLEFAQT